MSSDPTAPPVRGEILTGVQRRRRWSTTEKIRLVEESQQPGSSVSFVARPYGLSSSENDAGTECAHIDAACEKVMASLPGVAGWIMLVDGDDQAVSVTARDVSGRQV